MRNYPIMKKLFAFLLLLPLISAASDPLILREKILPGTVEPYPESSRETLNLTPEHANAGTLSLWVCPQNWDDREQAWHFFVRGGKVSSKKPHLMLYRFPAGIIRLLWSKNSASKKIVDINVNGEFTAGKWTHLAFTWEQKESKTHLQFYINGKLKKSRSGNFMMAEDFPLQWVIGDIPQWNPQSPNRTILGRCELYKRVLTKDEIAVMAGQQFTNGSMTYINRRFTPGSTNVICGSSNVPADFMQVVFAGESGKTTEQRIPVKNVPNGFEATLNIPESAVETRMALCKNDSSSPIWRITQISYAPWLPPLLPDYWQASWIWLGNRSAANTHRYLLREFEADPAELTLAAFQWACDERADVYINGTHIGQVNSWAVPQVNDKLLPLLKKGKNILAVDAYNYGGGAGFFGELTLLKKDGSALKIGSDDTWKASEELINGWEQPGFNSSGWLNAEILMRPPQVPYGMTPYRNFVTIPEVKKISPDLDSVLDSGQKSVIRAEYTMPSRLPQSPVEFSLHFADGEIFRTPTKMTIKDGKLVLDAEIFFPAAAIPGEYRVFAECRGMKFTNPEIGRITVKNGRVDNELTAEVKNINGSPVLLLNGQAVPAMLYRTAINFRNETAMNRFITRFDRNNIHLAELSIDLNSLWEADNSLNTKALDRMIMSAFFYAPDIKPVIFFGLNAPEHLVKKYPLERFTGNTGVIEQLSYASDIYRKETAAILKKIIACIKKRPYYNRIAGFGFGGGEDGQFMQWTGRNLNFIGDYSVPMQKYYHRLLQKKYGTIEKLNAAWQKSYLNFSEIPIPSVKRRTGDGVKHFLDPVTDGDIADFNRAFADSVADFLLDCAAAVKEACEHKKITMAYYGKFFSIAGHLQWGELAIEKVLNSPALDCLIAVEYNQRSSGNPHSVSAVPESYALHNKIFIDEADIRTFLSGAKNWAYAGTGFETVSMIRKMFIFNHVRGHGIHWYDIHGGAFENDAVIESIATVNRIARKNPAVRRKNAEIAFIVDENSFLHTTVMIRKFTGRYLQHMQNGAWNRIGAPFDVYFSGDLIAGRVPDHKMYVFTNSFTATPELLKAVDDLKNNRRMLVFLGNQGMINSTGSSMENISRFTGINVANGGKRNLALKLYKNDVPGNMTLSRTWYTSAGIIEPVALPADKDAHLFGALPDGLKPLALKKYSDWTSVFCAVPVLPPELWRELAKLAGVHIFSEDEDTILYIGADMIGVHCRNGGEKHIVFPENMDFIDAVTGEVYARNSKELILNMVDSETKLVSTVPVRK